MHGTDAAAGAAEASEALFGDGDLRALDAGTLEAAFADLAARRPSVLERHAIGARPARLLRTVGEPRPGATRARRGRRLRQQRRVTDPAAVPDRSDLLAGRWLLLRRGKRNLAVAEVARAVNLAFAHRRACVGLAAAGLTALLVWVVTVVTGSSDPWSVGPWLIPGAAAVIGGATFLAERYLHQPNVRRKRSTGEPWAYRELAPPSGRRARTLRGRCLDASATTLSAMLCGTSA